VDAGAHRLRSATSERDAKALSTWSQKVPAPLKKPSRPEPPLGSPTAPKRLFQSACIDTIPREGIHAALGAQWEISRPQR
jgi:hypothetical protein